MNDSQIRAAFPLPKEPSTLDIKIDRALARHTTARRAKRRIAFGTTATAVLAFGVVAFPAVRAQASIGGIFRALDRQTHLRAIGYNVDEAGRRWLSSTTTIVDGDVANVDGKGTRQTFDLGTKTYSLDPTIGRFIVRHRRPGGSIRLSDMLGGASGFSLGKRADVEKLTESGKPFLRATILNEGLPERYVIDADPATELPIRMHIDALERGLWRARTEIAFDYDAPATFPKPDFRRYPVTTEAEAAKAYGEAMVRGTLAQLPLKKGRIVIRKLDIAQDGTVFVAFQTGDRSPHSWRGYTLDAQGDSGNRYVRTDEIIPFDEDPFMSKDGKIEAEVFVPQRPIPPDANRAVALSALRLPDGSLGHEFRFNVTDHGKVVWSGLTINGWPYKKPLPSGTGVLRRTGLHPTCDVSPAWIARLDYTRFGNPIAAEMTKAHARATAAIAEEDWPEAETQLNEELRLKHEHEAQGYSPWNLSDTLDNLDKVHKALSRRKP